MTAPVRIPADVDMADRVIGPLTARQVGILGLTGLALYSAWDVTRALVPIEVFLALAVPVVVTAVILALGRRDGVPLDRLFLAALRHRVTPRTRVAHPTAAHDGVAPAWLEARRQPSEEPSSRRRHAVLRLPATSITDSSTDRSGTDLGIVDLGADGLVVVAVASTVNFALRTPAEQQALVATFGRYLHSLAAPVQVLVRAERLDLSGQIDDLRVGADRAPHAALRAAALEHADFLARLAEDSMLLRRQVLLVLREPVAAARPADGLGGPSAASVLASLLPRRRSTLDSADTPARRAAESRLARRLAESIELLASAGITITPLDAARTAAVLTTTCNPDALLPSSGRQAGTDDVISAADPHSHIRDDRAEHWQGNPDDWNDDSWDGEDWNGDNWDGEDWGGEDWGGEDWGGEDEDPDDDWDYDDSRGDWDEHRYTEPTRRGTRSRPRVPARPRGGRR